MCLKYILLIWQDNRYIFKWQAPPKPFAYEYGTVDDYGRHSAKTETQDEYGVVHGNHLY